MWDYLFNEIGSQNVKMVGIYVNWENFKMALRTVYGELNKEKTIKLQL